MRQYRGNRLETFKQGAIGYSLLGGCALSVISLILIGMFTMGGVFRGTYTRDPFTNKITDAGTLNFVPIAFSFFALGVLLMFGAVVYGLYSSATEQTGPRKSHPVKVLARYAFNREGLMIISEWEIEEAENPRFYVRLDFGTEMGTLECECSESIFYQCGEGMNGMAELQGKWLGSFIPYTGTSYRSEHVADDSIPNHFR